jgi:hypothetical protein
MNPSIINHLNALSDSPSQVIRIRQGPQFKTTGGTFLAIVFIMAMSASIALINEKEYWFSLASFILGTLALNLTLDIRGIELDKSTHLIRCYRSFLWLRFGKWSALKEFKMLYITSKKITVGSSDDSEYNSETYHYYHLKLVDEPNKIEIFLAEYRNYYKALKIAKEITDKTDLELRDFIKRPRKVIL